MGRILVHEFMTLDGVIDAPRWTFDYPFDPKMGQAIAGIMGSSTALLLGRRTYEEFAPAWSTRTAKWRRAWLAQQHTGNPDVLGGKRQQSELSCPLEGNVQRALVGGAGAGFAAWLNLAAL